ADGGRLAWLGEGLGGGLPRDDGPGACCRAGLLCRLEQAGGARRGEGAGARSVGGGGEPAVPPAPSRSGLNVGVSGAGEDYRQSWRGVSALDVQTNGGAADGKAENERGLAGATGVRQTAQSQAAAIAPATGSLAGVKLLV